MVNSLLVTLRDPVRVSISNRSIDDVSLVIDGQVTSRPSTPFWPACADILWNSDSRLFVGLSYRVDLQDRQLVPKVVSHLSDKVVLYDDVSSPQSRELYDEFGLQVHWVTIKWSPVPANKIEVAQLDCGYWYYAATSNGSEPLVFGLDDINEVLVDYGLVFPEEQLVCDC